MFCYNLANNYHSLEPAQEAGNVLFSSTCIGVVEQTWIYRVIEKMHGECVLGVLFNTKW